MNGSKKLYRLATMYQCVTKERVGKTSILLRKVVYILRTALLTIHNVHYTDHYFIMNCC